MEESTSVERYYEDKEQSLLFLNTSAYKASNPSGFQEYAGLYHEKVL